MQSLRHLQNEDAANIELGAIVQQIEGMHLQGVRGDGGYRKPFSDRDVDSLIRSLASLVASEYGLNFTAVGRGHGEKKGKSKALSAEFGESLVKMLKLLECCIPLDAVHASGADATGSQSGVGATSLLRSREWKVRAVGCLANELQTAKLLKMQGRSLLPATSTSRSRCQDEQGSQPSQKKDSSPAYLVRALETVQSIDGGNAEISTGIPALECIETLNSVCKKHMMNVDNLAGSQLLDVGSQDVAAGLRHEDAEILNSGDFQDISSSMYNEYRIRSQMLRQRIDVMCDSFTYAKQYQSHSESASAVIQDRLRAMPAVQQYNATDVKYARESSVAIFQSKVLLPDTIRESSLRKVKIGSVPDRGGRTEKLAGAEMRQVVREANMNMRGLGGGNRKNKNNSNSAPRSGNQSPHVDVVSAAPGGTQSPRSDVEHSEKAANAIGGKSKGKGRVNGGSTGNKSNGRQKKGGWAGSGGQPQ